MGIQKFKTNLANAIVNIDNANDIKARNHDNSHRNNNITNKNKYNNFNNSCNDNGTR